MNKIQATTPPERLFAAARPLRALILEGNPQDAELMVMFLKRAGYALSFEVVDSLAHLRQQRARAEVVRGSGRQFDPEVVRVFLAIPGEGWNNILCDVRRPAAKRASHRLGSDARRSSRVGQPGPRVAGSPKAWSRLISPSGRTGKPQTNGGRWRLKEMSIRNHSGTEKEYRYD